MNGILICNKVKINSFIVTPMTVKEVHVELMLTNFMEGKVFLKSHTTNQKIPCLLWNEKVHYCDHKSS
jgi:hypothetical protein